MSYTGIKYSGKRKVISVKETDVIGLIINDDSKEMIKERNEESRTIMGKR